MTKIDSERVYNLIKRIPLGKITTYKEIGNALNTKGYRAIGKILNKNPNPIIIPCHRVVKANGEVGGYVYGVDMKINLLKKEGILIKDNYIVNFKDHFFSFSKRENKDKINSK